VNYKSFFDLCDNQTFAVDHIPIQTKVVIFRKKTSFGAVCRGKAIAQPIALCDNVANISPP
jgi:hypothetical protein